MTQYKIVLVFFIVAIILIGMSANKQSFLGYATSIEDSWVFLLSSQSPTIKDINGKILDSISIGQHVSVAINIGSTVSEQVDQINYISILEIRDEDGLTVSIDWQDNDLTPGESKEALFPWKPGSTGTYSVSMFLISSLENPEILSAPSRTLVTVVENTSQLEQPLEEEKNAAENVPDDQSQSSADYTFMVYMVGSGLETNGYFASKDISEMMSAGVAENVNVLIQTGGALNATIDENRFIDFTKVQRHKIVDGELQLLQELGDKNMGEVDTLADFLVYGVDEFPAKNYVIVLWNDGSGINGFGTDTVSNDILSLEELEMAFADSKKTNNFDFELIGFDACLMASYEVITRLDQYGKYLVSSQELEPGWGWDYEAILGSLGKNSELTGAELGKIIADSYALHVKDNAESLEDYKFQGSITLSVIDLDKVNRIDNSLTLFSTALENRMNSISASQAFAKTIIKTERFGFGSETTSGHLDLHHLAQNFALVFPELADSSAELQSSIDDAIVYSVSREFHQNSHGMSVFLPLKDSSTESDVAVYSPPGWKNIMNKYGSYLESDHAPPAGTIYLSNDKVQGKIITADVYRIELLVHKEVVENTAAQIVTFVDDYVTLDAQGRFEYPFNKEFISLCNQNECVPVSMYIENSAETRFAIFPVRLEAPDFDADVSLIYHLDENGSFEFIGAWPGVDEEGNASRELRPLQAGDKIHTKSYQFDIRPGERYNKPVETYSIEVTDGFGPAYQEHEGFYRFSAGICDYSGNCLYSDNYTILNTADE